MAIWDQTDRMGMPPKHMIYGSEYRKEQIDYALRQDNPLDYVPVTDEIGHGTRLASIAAGNEDISQDFVGAAPYADIAVVKLKPAKQYLRDFYYIPDDAVAYQENDILTAMQYLNELAQERNQPIVFCIGIGTSQGDHGGGGRISNVLDDLAAMYRHAVCIAVGNEANARHHYYGSVKEGESDRVEINVTAPMRGFVMELWGRAPELFFVSVISPTGEVLPRVPVWIGQQQKHLFLLENTRLTIDYQMTGVRNRNQLVYFEFENPAQGIWIIEVFPFRVMDGNFNIFLPMTEFLERPVFFVRSSPDATLTAPSSAELPMAVGGYDAVTGGIYVESGRGYSLRGAIKPDYVAPAVLVAAQNNRGNYDTITGTSAACAVAAGGCALLMEWNTAYIGNQSVNSLDIKNQIVNGTERIQNQLYPNREEGADDIIVSS